VSSKEHVLTIFIDKEEVVFKMVRLGWFMLKGRAMKCVMQKDQRNDIPTIKINNLKKAPEMKVITFFFNKECKKTQL